VSTPEILLTMITDRRRAGLLGLPRLAEEAARAGIDLIQVREKDLEGGALRTLVAAVLAATEGTATRVLVNGRVDVAVSAGASGVQLPENGLGIADVKRSFPHLMIGASRHSVDGVKKAEADGADFVLFGPVWSTPGKEGLAVGALALRRAASQVRIPVHAIGGLEPKNAREAVEAGAAGIAAIRPFVTEPASAVAAFREALR
jgi:thiamine-phosphate pyrophosphorylase